ncbi:hypothetical protein BGX26_004233 [Mortierella sp. AD094]|nr:hypothetical protein BGX26_004233 [Mortierella sp. AD094]
MMANGAWGAPPDTDSSSDDSFSHQSPMQENLGIEYLDGNQDYSDEETMLENSVGSGISSSTEYESETTGGVYDERSHVYSRHQINYKISAWKETLDSASVPIAIPNKLRHEIDANIDDMELLDINALSLPKILDRHKRSDAMEKPDSCDEDEDLDECLPELSMAFVDPEKSHFEELLYWLYTGDNSRWLRFFAPENYGSILKNIRLLNIATVDAIDACLLYESKTSPYLGLKGMAQAILFEPQTDDTMDF